MIERKRAAGLRSTLAVALCLASLAVGATETPPEPYPLEYWAQRATVSNVELSRDGTYMGVMRIPTRGANPIIEVYETADLTREPFRLDADPMEILQYDWVSDEALVFVLRQRVRDQIDGFNQGVYEFKVALLDVAKKKTTELGNRNLNVAHRLPDQPNKIIVEYFSTNDQGPGAKIKEGFRSVSYHVMDLKTGKTRLLIRSRPGLGRIFFDAEGNPRFGGGFDRKTQNYVWYTRRPGASGWEEVHRQHEDVFGFFFIDGVDDMKPDSLLVHTMNGEDTYGLWSLDLNTKAMEPIYRRSDVDVVGVRTHSNPWTHLGKVVGVVYFKDRYHVEYFDEVEKATYAQLESIIPYAHHVRILSRSRDGKTMIVNNVGPRDPGSYYLLKDGKLQFIESRSPKLRSENLADLRRIEYKSRDGLTVTGFITVPHGKPPFPLVVMPHGGPFIHETILYDEWAQLLANNGYLVLQPQYRGSRGYGMKFYSAAFEEGGAGGYAMQDDKDDGALYLVEEGLADPDRMAMFGWSYGGYAALIAAARTPQLYQCTVAGAAVTDRVMQLNYFRDNVRGADSIALVRAWDKSISPIDEVENVNVPMLIVHGDLDQRVPVDHANKYLRELDKHGKSYKYVELEGADHFYNTLFYDHKITFYNAMIDYLENDCGPEGL
ncbi:MAG: prolyl oligopeptidase family serine peptidase [Gammaproteobacteria bacterium]|nr:prolyl oligopeptidase family serine peptidase [Gammaproteobacteria bacterium]